MVLTPGYELWLYLLSILDNLDAARLETLDRTFLGSVRSFIRLSEDRVQIIQDGGNEDDREFL